MGRAACGTALPEQTAAHLVGITYDARTRSRCADRARRRIEGAARGGRVLLAGAVWRLPRLPQRRLTDTEYEPRRCRADHRPDGGGRADDDAELEIGPGDAAVNTARAAHDARVEVGSPHRTRARHHAE